MSDRPKQPLSVVRAGVILAREPGGAYRTVAEIAEDAGALVAAAAAVRASRTFKARSTALAAARAALAPYRAHVDVAEGATGKYELRVQFTSGRYVNGRLHYYLPA